MATAVWKGQLTFGLLTFPVKLYAAARRETISFRKLKKREETEPEEDRASTQEVVVSHSYAQATPSLVQAAHVPAPQSAPEPVYTSDDRVTQAVVSSREPAEVVKGYEFEKDRFVAIDPAEIRRLAKSTSRDLEVTEFVRWEEIDPAYLDTSYYVVPDPAGEKPYSLLYAAMKKTGFAAVSQLAMHGREQVLILRLGAKGLVGHTMFYASEVRRDQESPALTDKLTPKEIQLASTLIEQMAGPFEPERYVDTYKQRVQELVDSKVSRVAEASPAEEAAPLSRKPPVDIMEALKQSLQKSAERKAPQQQVATPAARPKRKSA